VCRQIFVWAACITDMIGSKRPEASLVARRKHSKEMWHSCPRLLRVSSVWSQSLLVPELLQARFVQCDCGRYSAATPVMH